MSNYQFVPMLSRLWEWPGTACRRSEELAERLRSQPADSMCVKMIQNLNSFRLFDGIGWIMRVD